MATSMKTAKTPEDREKINWSKKIENTAPRAKDRHAEYLGATGKYKPYVHLVQLGANPNNLRFVNDYGQITETGKGSAPLVRNEYVPPPPPPPPKPKVEAAAPPPMVQPNTGTPAQLQQNTSLLKELVLIGNGIRTDIRGVVLEMGELHKAMRDVTKPLTDAFLPFAALVGSVKGLVEKVTDIQRDQFDAHALVLEEIRARQDGAVVGDLPPPSKPLKHVPAPIPPPTEAPAKKYEKTPAEAKIKGIEQVACTGARERLLALADHKSVESIIVANVTDKHGKGEKDGTFVPGPLQARDKPMINVSLHGWTKVYKIGIYVKAGYNVQEVMNKLWSGKVP